MQLGRAVCALSAAVSALLLILFFQARSLREGHLAAGTCEIVTLDRDSSQPRRTIARQTARCACRKGQIAGTTRASPACVDGHLCRISIKVLDSGETSTLWEWDLDFDLKAHIVRSRQWCEMLPCLDDESCDLLVNRSGWRCAQPGGKVKTTTVS